MQRLPKGSWRWTWPRSFSFLRGCRLYVGLCWYGIASKLTWLWNAMEIYGFEIGGFSMVIFTWRDLAGNHHVLFGDTFLWSIPCIFCYTLFRCWGMLRVRDCDRHVMRGYIGNTSDSWRKLFSGPLATVPVWYTGWRINKRPKGIQRQNVPMAVLFISPRSRIGPESLQGCCKRGICRSGLLGWDPRIGWMQKM